MNKSELVSKIASQVGIPKTTSEAVLDATIESIRSAVAKGQDVKLVGFGTFSRIKRKARVGRNPQTGEEYNIPPTKAPKFKPGKEFKEAVK